MGNLVNKALGGLGKAAGGFVGATTAAAVNVVAGTGAGIVTVAKGVGTGAKGGFNKVLSSKIKDAGKKGAKAVKEAVSNGSDVVQDAINFVGTDGAKYSRVKNPKWVEGSARKSNGGVRNQYLYTKDGQSISGKVFGQAHADAEKVAKNISETAAGEHAGFDLGEFMSDHPVVTAAAGVGAGFALGSILDDD